MIEKKEDMMSLVCGSSQSKPIYSSYNINCVLYCKNLKKATMIAEGEEGDFQKCQ